MTVTVTTLKHTKKSKHSHHTVTLQYKYTLCTLEFKHLVSVRASLPCARL